MGGNWITVTWYFSLSFFSTMLSRDYIKSLEFCFRCGGAYTRSQLLRRLKLVITWAQELGISLGNMTTKCLRTMIAHLNFMYSSHFQLQSAPSLQRLLLVSLWCWSLWRHSTEIRLLNHLAPPPCLSHTGSPGITAKPWNFSSWVIPPKFWESVSTAGLFHQIGLSKNMERI